MSKRRIAVLVVAIAVLLPLLAVAGYNVTTKWLLAGPPSECDLIPPSDLEQILKSDTAEVNRRTIRSIDGGWEYSCSYLGQTGGEDSGFLNVSVLTGTAARAGKLRDPRIMEEATQLPGLGDEAWVGENGALLRDGDTQVQVLATVDGPLPRETYEQALRQVSGRLSTVPDFPEAELTGVCEQLDLALIERVAGTKLPAQRAVVRDNGDAYCWFTGAGDTQFILETTTDEEQISTTRDRASTGTPIKGLPVKTARYGWERGDAMMFVVDDRRYQISFRPKGDGPLADRTDLPEMVVDTFTACSDDLAGCR